MAEIELTLSEADLDALAERIAARLVDQSSGGRKPEPLISEPEAAARFGVEPHVLRDARKRGEVEYHKVGKFVRYDPGQLAAWKERTRRRSK